MTKGNFSDSLGYPAQEMFLLNRKKFIHGLLVGGAVLIVFGFFWLRPQFNLSYQKAILAMPGGNDLICRRWGMPPSGYYNPASLIGNNINYYRDPEGPGGTGEVLRFRCDYSQALSAAGGKVENLKCDVQTPGLLAQDYHTAGCSATDPSTACYTPDIASFINQNYYDGGCQVIQIDLTQCNTQEIDVNGDGKNEAPAWHGGTAFVIAYNDECIPFTPTPTPTLTLTPTTTLTPILTPTVTPTLTLTPTITLTPTPTTTSILTPTLTLTTTPTPTQTVTPTLTLTPTPTITPTPVVNGCLYECSQDNDCESGLHCQERDGVKRCLNLDCSEENDCVCNRSCWAVCGVSAECPSNLECRQIDDLKRCVNPSCVRESDCDCTVTVSTPTPTIPQVLGVQAPPIFPKTGYSTQGLVIMGITGVVLRVLLFLI